MKRKNEKVPGFDEIIFENRNKEYGAYDLRKSYNRTTSISILSGVAIVAIIMTAFSLADSKDIPQQDKPIVIIQMSDIIKPDPVKPAEKPMEKIPDAMKNLAPVVTTDTSLRLDQSMITDDLVATAIDRNVNDTIVIIDPADEIGPDPETPFISVQEMPEFPGGIPALLKFIGDNLVYPEDPLRNNIQGRVIVKFVVEADGSVGRPEIISGVDPALNAEAIRVVKSLPAFRPGKQDGMPVPVWYIIPVLFKLENI